MPELTDERTDSDRIAEALLRDLDRLTGRPCRDCGRAICGHEAVGSIVLGFKDAPRCLTCLADGLGRAQEELADRLAAQVRRRDCYKQAWDAASDREGQPRDGMPACLRLSPLSRLCGRGDGGEGAVPSRPHPRPLSRKAGRGGEEAPDVVWDAGDMSCGDLVLALRVRLNALPPGSRLRVTATDPAAPEDLPAWCRLTGHTLLSAAHPVYDIRRKE